jgi:hypothetical protein
MTAIIVNVWKSVGHKAWDIVCNPGGQTIVMGGIISADGYNDMFHRVRWCNIV